MPDKSEITIGFCEAKSWLAVLWLWTTTAESHRQMHNFPRDEIKAHAELMHACKSKSFADMAFYSVPSRGTGPSIRFAEEVARVYGNFQYGHRELSRSNNKSEVEVFAWDMEKNNRSIRQITVDHVRYTKGGSFDLKDPTDIDNRIANVASKQIRGRILALMPKWMVAEAIEECKKTIAGGNNEPIGARVRKMAQAFESYGVTVTHLERYLGHKLSEVTIDEIVDLTGVFNALREGTPVSEIFNNENTIVDGNPAAEALKSQVKETQRSAPEKQQDKPAAQKTATKQAAKTAAKPQNSKPEQTDSKPTKEQAPVAAKQEPDQAPWDKEAEEQAAAQAQQPEPVGDLADQGSAEIDDDPF